MEAMEAARNAPDPLAAYKDIQAEMGLSRRMGRATLQTTERYIENREENK